MTKHRYLDQDLTELAGRFCDMADTLTDAGRFADAERFIDVGMTLLDAADAIIDISDR